MYRYRKGDVSIIKYVNVDSTKNTYLYIKATSTYLPPPENGVIFLFKDGSKFNLPNQEIDYDSGSGSYWNYTDFITISCGTSTKMELNSYFSK